MKCLTTNEFIERAQKVHLDKYDYSKVKYVNNKVKVCIICPKHGEFWQQANSHLQGNGCPCCANLKRPSLEEFIKKAKKIHANKYDYSKTEYLNSQTKICIVCPKHGEFWQKPNCHLNGQGCPKCKAEKIGNIRRYSIKDFVEKSRELHGNKYDYSKVDYKGGLELVTIICPKHGEFLQKPTYHLIGHGCPICKESKLEESIRLKLIEEGIDFEYCKSFNWLGKQHLDFYLPKYNIAIECQGEQHFKPIEHFGGSKRLKYTKEKDLEKFTKCKGKGLQIFYYSFEGVFPKNEEMYSNNVFTSVNDIMQKIRGYEM